MMPDQFVEGVPPAAPGVVSRIRSMMAKPAEPPVGRHSIDDSAPFDGLLVSQFCRRFRTPECLKCRLGL